MINNTIETHSSPGAPRALSSARYVAAVILLLAISTAVRAQAYRQLDQAELWYLTLDSGLVVIELNAAFAPHTVAQIKALTRAGFYQGKAFYRVIDGFVAQAGVGDGAPAGVPVLPLEGRLTWPGKRDYSLVQAPDMFAPATAFARGFAIGVDQAQQLAWLLHCPGAVGMSRANEPGSATSDFYIVIGQAPRYLDGIMTVFGRVVWGMDKVQAIIRADPLGDGIIPSDQPQTRIRAAAIGVDLSPAQQLSLAVERTDDPAFAEQLRARRHRDHPFFFEKPPAVLDACQVPLNVRVSA